MKKITILFFLSLTILQLTSCGGGSAEIEARDAKKYAGWNKSVKGKVAGIKMAEGHYKNPNYINLGKDYPNQDLTIVVYGDFQRKFKKDLKSLLGKNILVKGKIMWYKQNIQIRNPIHIEIIP